MAAGCLHCGLCDCVLLEISPKQKYRDALFLCQTCHAEFMKGYLVLLNCESCAAEYITDNDEQPFNCKSCRAFSNPLELLDSTTDSKKYTSSPMCIRKALRLYRESKEGEERIITRDRAFTIYKMIHGLPDTEPVLPKLMKDAKEYGLTPPGYIKALARIDITEEGFDDLVSIMKERGYLAYDAIENDWEEEQLGIQEEPNRFYKEYIKLYPQTLCLEADDEWLNLPF